METLLVATDLKPYSSAALSRGLYLAREDRAAVRLVHVHAGLDKVEQAGVRRRLEDWCRSEAPDVPVQIELRTGAPAEAILESAAGLSPYVIVVGAHPRRRLRDSWLGTTAVHILRQAAVPVLVVRSPAIRPYRRILAAVDATRAAGQVLALAASIASATDVHVVHGYRTPAESSAGHPASLEQAAARHRSAVEAMIRKAAPADPGLRFEAIVEAGDAMTVIAQAAQRVRPDLLLLGTEGRSGFNRLLAGSVAEAALAYFDLDMLIVRTVPGEPLLAEPPPSPVNR